VALAACTPQPSVVDVSLPTSDPIGAYGFSDRVSLLSSCQSPPAMPSSAGSC
jgi:hypothetical protein